MVREWGSGYYDIEGTFFCFSVYIEGTFARINFGGNFIIA